MRATFSIEWLKVRYYKTFWILFGLFVLGLAGVNYIAYRIIAKTRVKVGKQSGDAILGHPYGYPDVWHTISYFSGFLLFLPGLILITLITNEYTYKTHRQNIIDGWSRFQFIGVKLLWVVLFAIFSTIVVLGISLIFGAIGGDAFTFNGVEYIGYFFLEALSYFSVALLFGFWLKRAGMAIGLFFLYILILKNTLSALIDISPIKIGSYLPLSINDALISFPVSKDLVKAMIGQPPATAVLIAGSIVYLFLYFFVVVRTFERADL